MSYQSPEVMAERWKKLREIADGTLTLKQIADGMGVSEDAVKRLLRKDRTIKVKRKRRSDFGADGTRLIVAWCGDPVMIGGKGHSCGVCPGCQENDAIESQDVPRCKCGLMLPCHACIMPIEEWARSGKSNGCD